MNIQKWSDLSTVCNAASFYYSTKRGKEERSKSPQVKMSQTPLSSHGSVFFSQTEDFQFILWLTDKILKWLVVIVLSMFLLF